MRLNLAGTLRCDGCGAESDPFKVEVQIRPEVGVQFLPPEAPENWTKSLDRTADDPLRYFCPRCQRSASGARQVPIVEPKDPDRCPLSFEVQTDLGPAMVQCAKPKGHEGPHGPEMLPITVHQVPPPNPYDDEPNEGDEPT